MAMHARRLALGAAQFGLPYGISNSRGQVEPEDVGRILAFARTQGIDTLDTAIAYGDSETRLGEVGVADWQVISKLPAIPDDCHDVAGWVEQRVEESLARLKIHRLHALLLHRPGQLATARGEEIYSALDGVRARGLVGSIGASAYAPDDLSKLGQQYSFDLVQVPLNVVDRRFADSGQIERLVAQGAKVHARSLFLQGLLLMSSTERPAYFSRWSQLWHCWDEWLKQHRLSAVHACVRYAADLSNVSRFVVGVESVEQLAQIVSALDGPQLPSCPCTCSDPDLVNPSRWRVGA